MTLNHSHFTNTNFSLLVAFFTPEHPGALRMSQHNSAQICCCLLEGQAHRNYFWNEAIQFLSPDSSFNRLCPLKSSSCKSSGRGGASDTVLWSETRRCVHSKCHCVTSLSALVHQANDYVSKEDLCDRVVATS